MDTVLNHYRIEPCLPGFEAEFADEPAPAAETAQPVVEAETPVADGPDESKAGLRIGPFAACAVLALFAGVGVIAAHTLIRPRTVVHEVVKEVAGQEGFPFALLEKTTDPSLWPILSKMTGEVKGVPLRFVRGEAVADGALYRLCPDFCRAGNFLYARIDGADRLVVQVTPEGRIMKTYPAPKNGRPLRAIFQ